MPEKRMMSGKALSEIVRVRAIEFAGGSVYRRKKRKALCREIESVLPTVKSDAANVGQMLAAIRKVKESADGLFALYATRVTLNSGGDDSCPKM